MDETNSLTTPRLDAKSAAIALAGYSGRQEQAAPAVSRSTPKIVAAAISLMVATVLMFNALSGYVDDAKDSSRSISSGFAELQAHNYAALENDRLQHENLLRNIEFEAVAGIAFLVAGITLLGSSKNFKP